MGEVESILAEWERLSKLIDRTISDSSLRRECHALLSRCVSLVLKARLKASSLKLSVEDLVDWIVRVVAVSGKCGYSIKADEVARQVTSRVLSKYGLELRDFSEMLFDAYEMASRCEQAEDVDLAAKMSDIIASIAEEIYGFVLREVPYKNEPIDYVRFPDVTLEEGGDCDCQAALLARMWVSQGFKIFFVVFSEEKHVIPGVVVPYAVKLGDSYRWFPLYVRADPTMDLFKLPGPHQGKTTFFKASLLLEKLAKKKADEEEISVSLLNLLLRELGDDVKQINLRKFITLLKGGKVVS